MKINWLLLFGGVMTGFHIVVFIIGAIKGEKEHRDE